MICSTLQRYDDGSSHTGQSHYPDACQRLAGSLESVERRLAYRGIKSFSRGIIQNSSSIQLSTIPLGEMVNAFLAKEGGNIQNSPVDSPISSYQCCHGGILGKRKLK
ncbi:hypothetical protein JTE90_000362 [Oedothorax gibbosus]|uniref:Uncharacterized protein n=1 Tax=Oedothorax gibbosus TaxID=931172 RepID=A0AAV6TS47_9ARAC|nr:hypothetical protein JTE90_000362 [Oedothorax gibbosus]